MRGLHRATETGPIDNKREDFMHWMVKKIIFIYELNRKAFNL